MARCLSPDFNLAAAGEFEGLASRGTDSNSQPLRRRFYGRRVDHRSDVKDFLTSRRGRVNPEDAGVVSFGARRVPGLRRSEVAQLAGMSVEYYTRMERGNLAGVSEEVLNALATALRLDDSERSRACQMVCVSGVLSEGVSL